ncbi:MAG TPA: PhoU domain-containing protein [Candidatus Angelobacter sp.]|nr:PhoU domain-containing protein [Candidatus Angelobacter sp.]
MSLPALALSQDFSYAPDLLTITKEAFTVAKTAVSHAIDGLVNGSAAAFRAVKECEEQLDSFDRELDQRLGPAITQVNATEAQELLACMKLMIDLERTGDLVAAFSERTSIVRNRIDMQDVEYLTRMACLLENMLIQAKHAFCERDVDQALKVLRADSEMDRFRNLLLVRHTESPDGPPGHESLHVLLMATALERAGDHAKNMAEEVCHLVTGQTIRHLLKCKDKPVEQLYLDWLAARQRTEPQEESPKLL